MYVIFEVWARISKKVNKVCKVCKVKAGEWGKFQLDNIALFFGRLVQMRNSCVLINQNDVIL